MKLLKIKAKGLNLFEDDIEIDFFAKQKVARKNENGMVTNLFNSIYINNIISLVGINASGKTTILKLILFIMQVLNDKSINNEYGNTVFVGLQKDDQAIFEIYLYIERTKIIRKIEITVKIKEDDTLKEKMFFIENEIIWEKSIKSTESTKTYLNKEETFDFNESNIILERKKIEENLIYLMDDISINSGLNKKEKTRLKVIDSLSWTNFNGLRVMSIPPEIIKFLDPSIEYLTIDEDENSKLDIKLKFFNKDEITLFNPIELEKYLSSGTIKGINVFFTSILILKFGGYLLIDELENHFHKEIVLTIIRFFMDKEINKKGSVLIFSTHYIELLDTIERVDGIYLLKNKNSISIKNLADLLKRNDIKKSDAFHSGFIDEDTVPSYDSYINLRRSILD